MRFAIFPITMELTEIQKKEIRKSEKLIIDNLQPDCPLCDSDLEISKKQEGDSGAFAYKYRCSNENCQLRPYRTLYTPWYIALVKAVRNSVIGLLFTAAGSITLAGLVANGAGWISFHPQGKKANESSSPNATSERLIPNDKASTSLSTNPADTKKETENTQESKPENKPEESQANSNPPNQSGENLSFINRFYLALFRSNTGMHQNLSLAKDYFMEVIDMNLQDNAKNELSDPDKTALILRLRERRFGFETEEIEKIAAYIYEEGASLENRNYHLASFYNKLFTKTGKILYKYQELQAYLQHCQVNQVVPQIKEELKSVLSFLISSKSLDWSEADQNQILNAINTPNVNAILPQYIQKLQAYINNTSSQ